VDIGLCCQRFGQTRTVIPKQMNDTLPTLGVHESIRGRLRSMSAGRGLEIGYFRSCRCGAVIGDFTVTWKLEPPGPGFVVLTPVEGVSVHADRRLLDVLRRAAPELRLGGWLNRGTPSIRLASPEQWIDFLEGRCRWRDQPPLRFSPAPESTARPR
jgi:hypothetical protein